MIKTIVTQVCNGGYIVAIAHVGDRKFLYSANADYTDILLVECTMFFGHTTFNILYGDTSDILRSKLELVPNFRKLAGIHAIHAIHAIHNASTNNISELLLHFKEIDRVSKWHMTHITVDPPKQIVNAFNAFSGNQWGKGTPFTSPKKKENIKNIKNIQWGTAIKAF
jgi:hypothetical protein